MWQSLALFQVGKICVRFGQHRAGVESAADFGQIWVGVCLILGDALGPIRADFGQFWVGLGQNLAECSQIWPSLAKVGLIIWPCSNHVFADLTLFRVVFGQS